jgi:16S rRNA (guanine527-N7)-methyltransferase
MGFVSERDRAKLNERHILDSLRAHRYIRQSGSGYDLGSGAGLPGIPLACVRPDATFLLVERRGKRAGFLEFVIDELGITNVKVVASDVSRLTERRDFCLARAFAGAGASWEVASRLLISGGVLVYFAGASAADPGAIPSLVPADIGETRTAGPILLESGGPLVIMTKK